MKKFTLIISAFLMLFPFSLDVLMAQTFNLQNIPTEKKQIGLRFDKGFYSENYYNASALSGIYELNLNFPVSTKLNLTAAVPYIYTNYTLEFYFENTLYKSEYKESGLGNIFIGLQTKPELQEDKRTTLSFGVFLPTADEEAGYSGILVNYYYFQKYLPNSLGFYFNYAFHKMPERGFHYGVEAGPNFYIPTKKGGEGELFLHYGFNAGYQVENFLINAELLGLFIVSGETDNLSDRFIHMADFGFQWRGGLISPRLFYQLYLRDEFSRSISGVLGIGLTFSVD